MAFDWVTLVRMIHVLGAGLWVGGGIFMLFMVMPTVAAAGPAGKQFMMAMLRRGGPALFFAPASLVTIITGGVLYGKLEYAQDPFGTAMNAAVTIGMIAAILAFLEGILVARPTGNKLKKVAAGIGPKGPTPEQAAEMERISGSMRKSAFVSVGLVVFAFLLMTGRTLFL